jgi:hypothetical protein
MGGRAMYFFFLVANSKLPKKVGKEFTLLPLWKFKLTSTKANMAILCNAGKRRLAPKLFSCNLYL